MTRRSTQRPRRSLLVVLIVLLAAVGLAFAIIPTALAPARPLSCPYGRVILNGVEQCYPSQVP
jgi:hypothetical protein